MTASMVWNVANQLILCTRILRGSWPTSYLRGLSKPLPLVVLTLKMSTCELRDRIQIWNGVDWSAKFLLKYSQRRHHLECASRICKQKNECRKRFHALLSESILKRCPLCTFKITKLVISGLPFFFFLLKYSGLDPFSELRFYFMSSKLFLFQGGAGWVFELGGGGVYY